MSEYKKKDLIRFGYADEINELHRFQNFEQLINFADISNAPVHLMLNLKAEEDTVRS